MEIFEFNRKIKRKIFHSSLMCSTLDGWLGFHRKVRSSLFIDHFCDCVVVKCSSWEYAALEFGSAGRRGAQRALNYGFILEG